MKILLKNATIINEKSSFHNQKLDLLIVDGILSKIENNIDSDADKIIELIGNGSNTVSCYLNSLDIIKEEMKKSKKDEIYIFLGAGDITDWPYKILDDLNEN